LEYWNPKAKIEMYQKQLEIIGIPKQTIGICWIGNTWKTSGIIGILNDFPIILWGIQLFEDL
jgi:hypothetical protein